MILVDKAASAGATAQSGSTCVQVDEDHSDPVLRCLADACHSADSTDLLVEYCIEVQDKRILLQDWAIPCLGEKAIANQQRPCADCH